MQKDKISVVINTYNAEEHLREVLESVKDFDEIVVCDMESTDRTREIAADYGCKIVIFPKGEHKICEPARDFAIHSASNDWVLVVDADELVPTALREYLYSEIRKGFDAAYAVGRINMLIGEQIHSTPDYQLRFFRQRRAYWPAIIHARPDVGCEVKELPAGRKDLYLIHLDDASLNSRIDKLNRYSEYEVPKRLHRKFGIADLLFRPAWFFIKSLIIGKGYKDGKRGVINSYLSMIYQVILMSKVNEGQLRSKKTESSDTDTDK